MKRHRSSFNNFFALACACLCLGLAGGCASSSDSSTPPSEADKQAMLKKEQSTIRLYLEGEKADTMTSGAVLVTRKKFLYTVERDPFLTEGDLAKAVVVDDPNQDGGFYIQLLFDEHASLVLDMITASNKGKHIIVFAQFPSPDKKKAAKKKKKDDTDDSDVVEPLQAGGNAKGPRDSAWLAAVLIRTRISNGLFRFTPDASREEGIRIVRGVRNVLKKKKSDNKF